VQLTFRNYILTALLVPLDPGLFTSALSEFGLDDISAARTMSRNGQLQRAFWHGAIGWAR